MRGIAHFHLLPAAVDFAADAGWMCAGQRGF